jgi:ankyrin repeat protein
VAAGADPAKTPALKTVPQGGVTALLFLAANSHQSDAIPWLVARGADVNVVDSKGTTPLVMACAGTQFEVTFNGLSVMGSFLAGPNKKAPDGRIVAKSLLLAKDTMPDLQSLGFDDAKGRLAEISARRAATLTALIAAGADVVKADAEGTTALSKLAHTFDATSVGVLIAAGADPLRAAENKQPPLHAAAQAGVTETLLAMLAAKPDVNAANAKQQTPLMLAAHAGGDVETVIELLKAGADVAARDGLGNTPLHYAVGAEEWLLSRNASNELAPLVAKVLIAARADVNARNAAGKTPGDLAAGNAKYSASAAVLQDAEKQSRR